MIDGQNMCDQIMIEEGPNAHNQIAFCAFHSILQIHAVLSPGFSLSAGSWLKKMATWRLELSTFWGNRVK